MTPSHLTLSVHYLYGQSIAHHERDGKHYGAKCHEGISTAARQRTPP